MRRDRVFMNDPKLSREDRFFWEVIDRRLGIGPLHGTTVGKMLKKRDAPKSGKKAKGGNGSKSQT